MNITWNAQGYAERFDFVHRYGEDVLGLLDLPEGSRVVDLGCGNGALTEKLAEAGYRVLGLDASEEMLAVAREKHPGIAFRQADATTFKLDAPADGIFSNAVFHWIDAHRQDDLIGCLAQNLRPGGQLVFEFGGRGCAEAVHDTLERLFESRGLRYPRVFYFPTIGEYAPRLERQGFRVTFATLFDRPTAQASEDGLKDWINMFVKAPFVGMDDRVKAGILDEAEAALRDRLCVDGRWVIDYVRIRMKAVRV